MSNIEPVNSPCYCVNLRHAANSLTKYYDESFAQIQLTASQFFLINSISQLGSCNKTELSIYTRLERTTIIRNLAVLEKKGLILELPGETKRNKIIQLSDAGKQAVEEGQVIWERLQAQTRSAFGEENLPILWQLLHSIDDLVKP